MSLIVLLVWLAYYLAARATAHFSGGTDCLPPHLKGRKHIDRIWLTRWMTRDFTSRSLVEPPIMLLGTVGHVVSLATDGQRGPSAIPGFGQWHLSVVQVKKGSMFFLPYFACTTRFGLHFRCGARWDDVDHYFTLESLSLKIRKRKTSG